MQLSENEIIQKYGKQCGHCKRNTLLQNEYEFICVSCGYNVNKRKHEPSKIQRKKIIFINPLRNVEQKMFCICVDVYKIYKGDDYDKINKVLSALKNKNININSILIKNLKIC